MIHNALSPGLRAALSAHNTPLGVPPVFLADFASTESLVPSKGSGLSITRTGGATRVGPTGLVEFAPENLVKDSEGDSASWSHNGVTRAAGTSIDDYNVWTLTSTVSSGTAYTHKSMGGELDVPKTAYWVRVKMRAITSGLTLGVYFTNQNVASYSLQFNGTTGAFISKSTQVGYYSITADPDNTGWFIIEARFDIATIGTGNNIVSYHCLPSAVGQQFEISQPSISRVQVDQYYFTTAGAAYYSPRIDYDPATLECRGLLLEGAATNIVGDWTHSSQWGAMTPAPNGSSAEYSYGTDIFGNQDSIRISDLETIFSYGRTVWGGGSYTAPSDGDYMMSIFVKKANSPVSVFPQVRSSNVTSGLQRFCGLDPYTGEISDSTYFQVEDWGDWWRIGGYVFATTGNVFQLQVYPASYSSKWVVDGASTGEIEICYPQIEKGQTMTSVIPTFGGSITRTADQWDASAPVSPTGNSGTLCFEGFVNPNAPSTTFNAGILQLRLDDDNEVAIYCRTAYSDKLTAIVRSGGTPETPTPPTGPVPDPAIKVKVAFAWGPDGNSLYVDGVEYDSPGPTYNPSGLTSLVLGNSSPSSQNGNRAVSKVTLYNRRLPDTKLQTLTT